MWETIRKDRSAQFAILVFLFFTAWWIFLQIFVKKGDFENQIFGGLYGVLALLGGIYGIRASKPWGGFKSVIGRSILMFAFGLLLQEFGQIIYSYYTIFAKVEVPYPSLGDIGFFGSIPCYIYAVWLLAKVSGAVVSLRSFKHKIFAIVVPVIMLILSYMLFLQGYQFDWSKPLTIFLDFGYPFGEAIYISLALLTYALSRKFLGGIMKKRILFILFALVVQYASDFTFLYQNSNQIWYVGGINDYMYCVAYFLMTLGLIELRAVLDKIRK